MKRKFDTLYENVVNNMTDKKAIKNMILQKYGHLSEEEMLPLPDNPSTYFNMDYPNLEMVDLDNLQNTRARESGIKNALVMMYAISKGLGEGLGKRNPITVRELETGVFEVLDGNSTYNIAKRSGWKQMPVEIVDELPPEEMH
jgi:hypothetical protein